MAAPGRPGETSKPTPYGHDETVAIAVNGADQLLRTTGIADGLAHSPHGAFESRVADELLGPDLLAQLLLQDGAVPMLQQVAQDLEDFGPQPHGLAGTLQSMLLSVEAAIPEPVHHRMHPRASLLLL